MTCALTSHLCVLQLGFIAASAGLLTEQIAQQANYVPPHPPSLMILESERAKADAAKEAAAEASAAKEAEEAKAAEQSKGAKGGEKVNGIVNKIDTSASA